MWADRVCKPICIFVTVDAIVLAFARNHCVTGSFPSRIRVLRSRHFRSPASYSRHCWMCASCCWKSASCSWNCASRPWNSASCIWDRALCSWNRASYSHIRTSCAGRVRCSRSSDSLMRRRRNGVSAAVVRAALIFGEQNILQERAGIWVIWEVGGWESGRGQRRW